MALLNGEEEPWRDNVLLYLTEYIYQAVSRVVDARVPVQAVLTVYHVTGYFDIKNIGF